MGGGWGGPPAAREEAVRQTERSMCHDVLVLNSQLHSPANSLTGNAHSAQEHLQDTPRKKDDTPGGHLGGGQGQ